MWERTDGAIMVAGAFGAKSAFDFEEAEGGEGLQKEINQRKKDQGLMDRWVRPML